MRDLLELQGRMFQQKYIEAIKRAVQQQNKEPVTLCALLQNCLASTNEIGTETNRRRKRNQSGMISHSWLTCIHSSAVAASDLLVPLVNNEAPSVTDQLTDRPPGRAPSLFITKHSRLQFTHRACLPSFTAQHPFMTLSASYCIYHTAQHLTG